MTKPVVQCGCGARFAAEERLAGQVVPCPVCQQPLAIPAGVRSDRISNAAGGRDPKTHSQPLDDDRRTKWIVIALAFGSVILVVVFCVPIVYIASHIKWPARSTAVGPPSIAPGTGPQNGAATAQSGTQDSTDSGVSAAQPQAVPKTDPDPRPPQAANHAGPAPNPGSAETTKPATANPIFPQKPGPLPVDPCSVAFEDRFIGAFAGCDFILAGGGSPYLFSARVRRDGKVQIGVGDLSTGKDPLVADIVPPDETDSKRNRSMAPALVAGSPDGTRVALTWRSTRDTPLEIWKVDGAPSSVLTIPSEEAWGARWVAFANADTVLVASTQQQVDWWSISQSRKVHSGPFGPSEFTPGRRYLAVANQAVVGFFEAATGQLVSTVATGQGRLTSVEGFAFRPDGRRMVVFGSGPNTSGRFLELWDLESSKSLLLAPLPSDGRHFNEKAYWLEPDLVMVGNYVFSLDLRQVVWKYAKVPRLYGQAGGRVWTQAEVKNDIVAVPVAPIAADKRGSLPALASRVAVHAIAGQPFGVEFKFDVTPPKSQLKEQLQQAVRKRLESAGHPVAASHLPVLKVTFVERDLGGSVPFVETRTREGVRGSFGKSRVVTGGSTVDIPNRELQCVMSLTDAAGKVVWTKTAKVGVDDLDNVSVEQAFTSSVTAVLDARWNSFANAIHSTAIPADVIDFSQVAEIGWLAAPPPPSWLAARKQYIAKDLEIDAKMSLTKIDLAAEPPTVAWSVTLPKFDPSNFKPLLSAPLPLGQGRAEVARFSSFETGQVALVIAESRGKEGRFLHRYDLRQRKRLARMALAERSALLDLRLDGEILLLADGTAKRNLQFWKCGETEDTLAAEIPGGYTTETNQAWCVGRDLVLVLDRGGQLLARKLPTGEIVYRLDFGSSQIAFSRERDYFVNWRDLRVRVHRSSDGEQVGVCEPPQIDPALHRDTILRWAAFHPTNGQLAVSLGTPGRASSGHLGVWNLDDGSLVRWFPTLGLGQSGFWCGPKELLVDDFLLDTELEGKAWRYAQMMPGSPDGRAWCTMFDRKNVEHLLALPIPSREVRDGIERVQRENPPWMTAQDTLAIEYTIDEKLPHRDEFAGRLREHFQQMVDAHRVRIAPDATKLLTVRVHDNVDRSSIFRVVVEGREVLLRKRSMLLQVELATRDKRLVNQRLCIVTIPNIPYRIDPKSPDPDADVARSLQDALLRELQRMTPPVLYLPTHFQGFGTSTIGPDGERAVPHLPAKPATSGMK